MSKTYVVLNPRTLSLGVRTTPGAKIRTVEIDNDKLNEPVNHFLSEIVLFKVLYPAVQARDRAKGVFLAYKLVPPDPWLVSLALLIWEGIVQGVTWELLRISVRAALKKLQGHRIAPTKGTVIRDRKKSKTKIGFVWTEYIDEKKQREVFLGLKREYERTHKAKPLARTTLSTTRKRQTASK